jgi:hypothetical protein
MIFHSTSKYPQGVFKKDKRKKEKSKKKLITWCWLTVFALTSSAVVDWLLVASCWLLVAGCQVLVNCLKQDFRMRENFQENIIENLILYIEYFVINKF